MTVAAQEVNPGDRVRTAAGDELVVTRIESPFMGRSELIAFIEDSPERWFKQPIPVDGTVEVLRAS
jgi:hypothetical protein